MSTIGPCGSRQITVVGSGVIGLTTALILARRGIRVRVIGRELPSDALSQDWASPWAGANWCPFGTDPRICRWETEAFARLCELIPAGLAMKLPAVRYAQTEAGLVEHWYRDIVGDYKHLEPRSCPRDGVGVSFTTLSVNAPEYCKWLQAQCAALGVEFEKRSIRALSDVLTKEGGSRQIIINATGLGAKALEDVKDEAVEPIRGQVVLVRAPKVKTCTMDGTKDPSKPHRSTYVIPRPNSGGLVICGGTFQYGSTDREVDHDLSKEILDDCLKYHPDLATDGEVDVVRHCVGFRPSRKGGPRLERESKRTSDGRMYEVVHAYGIGPAGFQASWGMAKEACDLALGIYSEEQDDPVDVSKLRI